MLAGLTLAVLVFLFLVYLPGAAALTAAGRSKSERNWASAVSVGAMVFGLGFSLAWVAGYFSTWAREMVVGVVETMLAASGYSQKRINIDAVMIAFSVEYLAAVALGLGELFFVLKGLSLPWRRKRGPALHAENLLLGVLARYRKVEVRPRMIVRFAGGREPVRGECLRYSWNGRETVLLRDLDDPRKVAWVDLADATEIEFDNWSFLKEAENGQWEARKLRKMIDAYRSVLNWMAPGLGDEAYGPEKRPADREVV